MTEYKKQHQFTTVVVIAALFLTALPVSADVPPRGWTLGPAITGFWGQAHEIVWDTGGAANQNRYLSLLRWDIKPAVFLGVESRWESGRNHGLLLALHAGIPGIPTGEMNNFDWLLTDRDWSHWSKSDTTLAWGFILDAVYDWTPIRAGLFSMNLGAGYHLDWWSWRDSIKDSMYSNLTSGMSYPRPQLPTDGFRDRPDALPLGVNAVNFDVFYHVPLVKIGVGLELTPLFIGIHFRLGPVLAFSHDHHRLRNDKGNRNGVHFYDTGFGGLWVDTALEFGFRSADGFSLRLKGQYAWLGEFSGDTTTIYPNGAPGEVSPGAAGFAFWRVSAGFIASWSLKPPR